MNRERSMPSATPPRSVVFSSPRHAPPAPCTMRQSRRASRLCAVPQAKPPAPYSRMHGSRMSRGETRSARIPNSGVSRMQGRVNAAMSSPMELSGMVNSSASAGRTGTVAGMAYAEMNETAYAIHWTFSMPCLLSVPSCPCSPVREPCTRPYTAPASPESDAVPRAAPAAQPGRNSLEALPSPKRSRGRNSLAAAPVSRLQSRFA